MDIVSHIYQTDKEYRPHFYRWVEAESELVAITSRAMAQRQMGELQPLLDLMTEQRVAIVKAQGRALDMHDAAAAAIQRWIDLAKIKDEAYKPYREAPEANAPQS